MHEKNLSCTNQSVREKYKSRSENSAGIANNRFNFSGHPHQFPIPDREQALGMIPLKINNAPVTVKSILEWDGQATSVMILPADTDVARACQIRKPNDQLTCVEIDEDDPLVENVLDIFAQLLRCF